jgi:chromate reductase
MRVLLISGSLRSGSTNTALLRTAQAVAPAGVETVLYEGMGTLPHFNPDDDAEGLPVAPLVAELRAAIAGADALLLSTPEYAGALPGSFKNLLEWTVGNGGTYRKPVAWVNTSGAAAPTGAADAHDSLRKVLGYVGAQVVEDACVRIPVARDVIGPDGLLSDRALRVQVAEVLRALARHVEIHHQMR